MVVIYLVYSLLAKPKGTGALEFLLSKPVTREEIFVNKFLSGAMIVFILSGVFLITSSLTLVFLTGTSMELTPTLFMFLGLSLSLLAYYSLLFLIGSSVKSSAVFLGISISAFIFFFIEPVLFFILPNTIHVSKNEYYLEFYAPLAFMEHYAKEFLSPTVPVFYYSAPLEVVDVLFWIFVPFAIGYIIFTQLIKKRRLMSNK
ncbi:ABC transporter permease subunit [Sulfuracidifex tepidarius]|uniref:ABC-2 type transporter domain-containing protein n=1 Tax=Sulfuracidifex tepidarius TaxID=1294262 RepID=A0A510E0Y6_9CREN|nr:ABC transporter permease subunit [Sulfuracidifex tepidarius]BBG23379.1 hypothetical protein IC006_0663 [Sulfuracidifex tepidarius]BBG26132.1 hypothetical protein IC007_0637 [Sulfuracidifex tepidarius]